MKASGGGGVAVMLLMLEDNKERLERFEASLRILDAKLPLTVWSDAWRMIREVEEFLPLAALISLDHDLEPPESEPAHDPGDGMDAARFLAARPPVCPVIVHSSNRERSTWMMGEFELGRWKAYRVAPIGDDWIEQDWLGRVRRLLRKRRSAGPNERREHDRTDE